MNVDILVKDQIPRIDHLPRCSMLPVVALSLLISGCSWGLKTPLLNSISTDPQSEHDDRLQRHIYAGIGVGASTLEPDTSGAADFDVKESASTGAQITLGLDFNKLLSFETHLATLGSAELSPSGEISYDVAGASALFYVGSSRHFYKRRGFTGFGRVTTSMLSNDADDGVPFEKDNTLHVGVGAGLEYMTAMGLGVRAEAISYAPDVLYTQLGLIYRFGRMPRFTKAVTYPTPEPEAEDRCHSLTGILEGVNFLLDSAELTDTAVAILDGVADTLSKCENIPIHISAHTDSLGSDEYNIDLSQRRADSVLNHLQSRGIEASRMSSEVFGESMPIDSNDTEEGRSRNRRVELQTREAE